MPSAVGCALTSIVTAGGCWALWSGGVTDSWLGALVGLAAGLGTIALYVGLTRFRNAATPSTSRADEPEQGEGA